MDLALLVAPIAADLGEEIGSHVYWGNAPEAGALYSGVLHIDTVISTLAVMAILIGAALYLRSRITSGVPGPLQNALEAVIGYIDDAAGDQVGPKRRASIAPLAVTLALFIAISNWIGLVPTGGLFKSPTADLNTTLALALVTVGWVQFSSIKSRGLGGYFGHFFKPFKLLAPINVIEEIAKPITLAFRLFGNIAAGEIMLVVIGSLPVVWLTAPIPNLLWVAFSLFVGGVQAFIFMMLSIAYYGIGTEQEGH